MPVQERPSSGGGRRQDGQRRAGGRVGPRVAVGTEATRGRPACASPERSTGRNVSQRRVQPEVGDVRAPVEHGPDAQPAAPSSTPRQHERGGHRTSDHAGRPVRARRRSSDRAAAGAPDDQRALELVVAASAGAGSRARDTAARAISAMGWATTVSGGQEYSASLVPSKLTTARSPGTREPPLVAGTRAADGEQVGAREDRRRRVGGVQQQATGLVAAVAGPGDPGDGTVRQSGVPQRVAPPVSRGSSRSPSASPSAMPMRRWPWTPRGARRPAARPGSPSRPTAAKPGTRAGRVQQHDGRHAERAVGRSRRARGTRWRR